MAKRQGTGFTEEQKASLRKVALRIISEGRFTQDTLADRIGVHKASVNKMVKHGMGLNPEASRLLCKAAGIDFTTLIETGEELEVRPSVRDLPSFPAVYAQVRGVYAEPVIASVVRILDGVGVSFINEAMVSSAVQFRQRILRMKPDEADSPLERVAAAMGPSRAGGTVAKAGAAKR